MNIFQKLIQHRKKGGLIYNAKAQARELCNQYPTDAFVKQELCYWQKVYWLTGEVTQRLGINKKHAENRQEWLLQKYEMATLKLNDITIHIDHPCLTSLVNLEYTDIYPSGMYYDKNGQWRSSPKFPTEEPAGEGPYETEDVQLHNNDVVIDCGANMGLFSILAIKRGAGTVYAFDPQERAQKLLDKNIMVNGCGNKIHIVPYGLSDKKCTLHFAEVDDNMGASRISQEENATTTIECTTIDDWVTENNIPRIDFIKADIEGSERDMLNGARKTIKRDHPRLSICTYHLPDDPEVLRDIIVSIDPTYHIDQREKKLYAW